MTTIGYTIKIVDFQGSLPQCVHYLFFNNISYAHFFDSMSHNFDIESLDSFKWLECINECVLVFDEVSETIQMFGDPVRNVGVIQFQTYFECRVIQLHSSDLQCLLFSGTGYRKIKLCILGLFFFLFVTGIAVLWYVS